MIAVGRMIAVVTALGLVGCASTFPDGVVKDQDQAIATAAAQCVTATKGADLNWRATLTDHTWTVWANETHFTLLVEIDARDGKTPYGCAYVVVA